MSDDLARGERLQIMLTKEEVEALDNWRFNKRMPSRAAAVRELLKRGDQLVKLHPKRDGCLIDAGNRRYLPLVKGCHDGSFHRGYNFWDLN